MYSPANIITCNTDVVKAYVAIYKLLFIFRTHMVIHTPSDYLLLN